MEVIGSGPRSYYAPSLLFTAAAPQRAPLLLGAAGEGDEECGDGGAGWAVLFEGYPCLVGFIAALLPTFLGEGSPTKIGHRKQGYPYSDLSTGGPRVPLSFWFHRNPRKILIFFRAPEPVCGKVGKNKPPSVFLRVSSTKATQPKRGCTQRLGPAYTSENMYSNPTDLRYVDHVDGQTYAPHYL